LHFKSAAIIAARAAGKQPIAGLWQDVRDLEGFSQAVALHRQLGFTGELLIHPSHVAQANAAYSPDEEEIRYYSRMIEAFEQAEAEGRAAVIYDGEHIDSAHVKTARLILKQAESFAASAVTTRARHTI
jgi:citrate lyase subunit beta/citryl-CoA lyase